MGDFIWKSSSLGQQYTQHYPYTHHFQTKKSALVPGTTKSWKAKGGFWYNLSRVHNFNVSALGELCTGTPWTNKKKRLSTFFRDVHQLKNSTATALPCHDTHTSASTSFRGWLKFSWETAQLKHSGNISKDPPRSLSWLTCLQLARLLLSWYSRRWLRLELFWGAKTAHKTR